MNEQTLQALHSSLQALGHQIPRLLQEHPDEGEFCSAFAELADPIMEFADRAGEDASEYAIQAIDELLIRAGKIDPAHRQT